MAANITSFPSLTPEKIDSLIKVGLVIEYLLPAPYHSLPMTKAIHAVAHPNNTSSLTPVNLTKLLTPVMGPDFPVQKTVTALDIFLTLLGDNNTHRSKLLGWTWALTLAAIIAMAIGIFARIRMAKELRIYDYVTILALLQSIGFGYLTINGVYRDGAGGHIYHVSRDQVIHYVRGNVIGGYLYHFCNNTIKISLLLFYLHLSPHRKFRVACFFALGLIGILTIVGTFLIVFGCKPIDYWNHPLTAKCLPRAVLYTVKSAVQIATDILIWLLPIPVVWSLKLRLREKIIVAATFAVGVLICIASILRLFNEFINGADKTYATADAIIWSAVEIDLAIVCSCVPAIRTFINKYAPSLLGNKPTPKKNTMDLANDVEVKPKPSTWRNHRTSLLSSIWGKTSSHRTSEKTNADRGRVQQGVNGTQIIVDDSDEIKDLEDIYPVHTHGIGQAFSRNSKLVEGPSKLHSDKVARADDAV